MLLVHSGTSGTAVQQPVGLTCWLFPLTPRQKKRTKLKRLAAETLRGLKYFLRGEEGLWHERGQRKENGYLQTFLRGALPALRHESKHTAHRSKGERVGRRKFIPFWALVVVSKNLTVSSWMESTAAWAFFCHSSSSRLRPSTRRGPRRSVSREICWPIRPKRRLKNIWNIKHPSSSLWKYAFFILILERSGAGSDSCLWFHSAQSACLFLIHLDTSFQALCSCTPVCHEILSGGLYYNLIGLKNIYSIFCEVTVLK